MPARSLGTEISISPSCLKSVFALKPLRLLPLPRRGVCKCAPSPRCQRVPAGAVLLVRPKLTRLTDEQCSSHDAGDNSA
jgi:hypothetical protein